MPAPTPPGTISPSIMLTMTVPPPAAVRESWDAFTAPVDVPVVATAKSAEAHSPKRVSLPSIAAPAACAAGECAPTSAQVVTASETDHSTPITARIARPCRRLPSIVPSVRVSATGRTRIRKTSRRLVIAVGFSNGCAELALKKPPPLLPSSLMASWLATGPPGEHLRVAGQRATSSSRRSSARRHRRRAGARRRTTGAAGCGSCRGSGRPRSCRGHRCASGRSRGSARPRRRCRRRRRGSSARRGRPSAR